MKLIYTVKASIPEARLNFAIQGGFDVQLSTDYTDHEQYVIYHIGKFLRALSNGWLKPVDEGETHFMAAIKGDVRATNYFESAWLKFKTDYPELATGSRE